MSTGKQLKAPSDEGVAAFYDYEGGAFTEADALKLVDEVKTKVPELGSLDPKFVVKLRAAIVEGGLKEDLPHDSLLLFLSLAQVHAKASYNSAQMLEVVNETIRNVKIIVRSGYTETASESRESTEAMRGSTAEVANAMTEAASLFRNNSRQLQDQYVGAHKDALIDEIMGKTGGDCALGNDYARATMEEVFANQATKPASLDLQVAYFLEGTRVPIKR